MAEQPTAGLGAAAGRGGFRRHPDGREAVRDVAALAARAGLPLTLYSVVSVHASWFLPEVVRPEEETIPIEVRKGYQEALDRALAGLPDGVRSTGELLYGLGTVASVLLRRASVPVLVAPRGGG